MSTGASPVSSSDDSLASGFEQGGRDAWLGLVSKAIKGAEFEKKMVTKTADGLRIEPVYTRADALPATDAALPGAAPFTRGQKSKRTGLGWDIRQFYSETDAKTLNAAILDDLAGGTNSLAIHIEAPGTSGLPLGQGNLTAALDGVLLDMCPVAIMAGENVHDAAAALNAVWQERGIAADKRLGHYWADPLGTLAQSGGLSEPVEAALARAAKLAAGTLDQPGVTALAADGHPYHAAGATEAQELAAMLATLVAYLRAGETQGLAPDRMLAKIAVGLTADADQFLTIAKLRAGRRLIWRVADAAGAGEAAANVHISSATAWRMMARRDPWTNILRTTIACTAAALGGADAICVLPFTYALGRSDPFARRVARNIQIVCQEESNLGRVADPAGGSWYIEKLTDDLARKAWALFQEIEAYTSGNVRGMAAALASGFVQDEIAKSADARAKAIATGRGALTGVSAFPLLGDDGITAEPWSQIKDKAKTVATVKPLAFHRLGEAFEALRDKADARKDKSGAFPQVFLANIGQIIDHNVRSTWMKNYLAAGGIEALTNNGFASAEEAAVAFKASGVNAACICSSDALYAEYAEATAKALKAAGARLVLLAGRPPDNEAALTAAGVDEFIAAGQDAVAVLSSLQEKLG